MIRIGRLIKSFSYAFKGLFKALNEEQNLRIQTMACLTVLALAFYLKINRLEWASLILAMNLVLATEVINCAVERITDVLKPRINSYVKEIKDIMAAAVLLSSIAAGIVGLLVFWPYAYKLFGQF